MVDRNVMTTTCKWMSEYLSKDENEEAFGWLLRLFCNDFCCFVVVILCVLLCLLIAKMKLSVNLVCLLFYVCTEKKNRDN